MNCNSHCNLQLGQCAQVTSEVMISVLPLFTMPVDICAEALQNFQSFIEVLSDLAVAPEIAAGLPYAPGLLNNEFSFCY